VGPGHKARDQLLRTESRFSKERKTSYMAQANTSHATPATTLFDDYLSAGHAIPTLRYCCTVLYDVGRRRSAFDEFKRQTPRSRAGIISDHSYYRRFPKIPNWLCCFRTPARSFSRFCARVLLPRLLDAPDINASTSAQPGNYEFIITGKNRSEQTTTSVTLSITQPASAIVNPPTINPNGGTFANSVTVTLQTTSGGPEYGHWPQYKPLIFRAMDDSSTQQNGMIQE
jgi:hypothetical protein